MKLSRPIKAASRDSLLSSHRVRPSGVGVFCVRRNLATTRLFSVSIACLDCVGCRVPLGGLGKKRQRGSLAARASMAAAGRGRRRSSLSPRSVLLSDTVLRSFISTTPRGTTQSHRGLAGQWVKGRKREGCSMKYTLDSPRQRTMYSATCAAGGTPIVRFLFFNHAIMPPSPPKTRPTDKTAAQVRYQVPSR